ncbi:hypothetical protein [Arthrobacter sp. Alg241-R88]|uniref:hypothetical protein n=1 Tax=Arthrobacter sp. Alg241-R88 TaxID=2305984 RepID=UPI001967AB19|nr:hypothetical protein [Arthrobacter sp. Alg241-R88]
MSVPASAGSKNLVSPRGSARRTDQQVDVLLDNLNNSFNNGADVMATAQRFMLWIDTAQITPNGGDVTIAWDAFQSHLQAVGERSHDSENSKDLVCPDRGVAGGRLPWPGQSGPSGRISMYRRAGG